MKQTVALLFAILLPLPAAADMAKARTCSEGLSPSASAIYQGTLQAIRSGKDPKDALKDEVQSLISSGSLAKENAKGVTSAAVECMKLLKS